MDLPLREAERAYKANELSLTELNRLRRRAGLEEHNPYAGQPLPSLVRALVEEYGKTRNENLRTYTDDILHISWRHQCGKMVRGEQFELPSLQASMHSGESICSQVGTCQASVAVRDPEAVNRISNHVLEKLKVLKEAQEAVRL